MPDEDQEQDARFGQPLFGESVFSEQPAPTLIQARSEIIEAVSERRYS